VLESPRHWQLPYTFSSVAVCPDKSMKEESTQSWNAVGTTEDLLKVYEAFPEWLKKTLS